MIYYSKVSYSLLIIVFIVFFGPLIQSYIYDDFNSNMVLMTVGLIILYGFILHMFFNTIYTIDNERLHISSGFFRYNSINIMEIKKISKSHNMISSPAASFDRIEISYGKFEEIIISPKHKLKFSEDLQKINPGIINNLGM